MMPVYTAIVGDSSDLLLAASELYISGEDLVIDLTYGRGVMWKKMWRQPDVRNDIAPVGDSQQDFRNISFADEMFDVTILDPPYKLGTSRPMNEEFDNYGNVDRGTWGISAIRKLYRDGMKEAYRITKPKGKLMTKVMDQVESGKNHWLHIDIYRYGLKIGWNPLDLFILVRKNRPPMRHSHQVHSRKNLSYFWIFDKR